MRHAMVGFRRLLAAAILIALCLVIASNANAADDTTPPTVQSLSVSPGTVNAGGSVTVTARLTDAGSGVKQAYGFYRLANGQSAPSGASFVFVSGTPQDGTWQAIVQVPSAAASGTWTLYELQ